MTQINGRVICINREAQLAAIDIGWGEAIVVEFPDDLVISKGDTIENLARKYGRIAAYNRNRSIEFPAVVLSGGIPKATALYVVNGDIYAAA